MARPVKVPRTVTETVERAVARYERGLAMKLGDRRVDADVRAQVEHYRQAILRDAMLVERVREILKEAEMPPFLWPFYYAFARRLAKRKRDHDGDTLLFLAEQDRQAWLARGFDPSVLDRVYEAVMGEGR